MLALSARRLISVALQVVALQVVAVYQPEVQRVVVVQGVADQMEVKMFGLDFRHHLAIPDSK
jgi:hypothetical protein